VIAEGFQFLIDYKSPIEFTTFSFGDVLAGRVPGEQLKDRIVLIGGDADSVKDNLATPLTPSCRGVVLHAQVLNQLLRAALDGHGPTRSWPDWLEMAWCFAWACLGALCGFAAQRSAERAALLFGFCLAALAGATIAAFLQNWWLPAVAPFLNYIISGTGAFALASYRERRERAELMQLFSRHVSDKVAQSIWEQRDTFLDGNRPRPQKITATVLFTDFVGFSSVSELKDPASLLQWLNEGMERLAQQVEAHDGIVNKYIGDAIMAIFGVPVPRQSTEEIARDARNAVRCALAMSAELESLNAGWRASGVDEIGMRIGICTGPLVAGSMGSAARLEFTVIGDTVNTASRLESTKKDEIPPPAGRACRILVSESTWQQLGGLFESDFEAEEELKGKERKVKIRRIVAEKRLAIPEPLASITP
jgi:adenylate cyclase